MALDPPRFLEPGDVVRIEIEGLGDIEHAIALRLERAAPARGRAARAARRARRPAAAGHLLGWDRRR